MTTATATSTIAGYFSSHAKAETAVDALTRAGFNASQIGIAARSTGSNAVSSSQTSPTHAGSDHSGSHTGVWDKVKNFFEGGTPAEPYAGEAQNEGNLATREITYNDYEPSDMHQNLAGLSVADEHSKYFGHRFSQGEEGAVVTVTAPGREQEAREILEMNGADLGEDAENYDYANQDVNTQPNQMTDNQNIQLYGEVLRVHKDRISRGEVRLRKEVITETQTIEVPVTREELVIERVAATGRQSATGASFDEQEIRIPLSEERASVDKEAVLREEIRVGKREVTEMKSMDGQVRHEELKIDDTTNQSSR